MTFGGLLSQFTGRLAALAAVEASVAAAAGARVGKPAPAAPPAGVKKRRKRKGQAVGRRACILGGSEDETARLWDAVTGKERAALRRPVGKVRAVAVVPDGMTAAAAGDNGDVVVWDVDEA